MIFLLSLSLALFLVPMPWAIVVVAAGAAAEVAEIVWGRRLARKLRPQTGAEAMIGMRAEVVAECRPKGRVRLLGELWEATAPLGADAGDTVRVDAIEGLTLVVSRPDLRA